MPTDNDLGQGKKACLYRTKCSNLGKQPLIYWMVHQVVLIKGYNMIHSSALTELFRA